MFGKKDTVVSQNTGARTMIGEGITINNEGMFGAGDVKVAGVFFNDIEIDGMLIVQDTGTVRGDVKAANVVVEGFIEGNVVCSNLIQITATGKVVGDLRCMTLTIDEGASFSGLCEMGDRIKANGLTFKEDQREQKEQKGENWDVNKEIKFSLGNEEEEAPAEAV